MATSQKKIQNQTQSDSEEELRQRLAEAQALAQAQAEQLEQLKEKERLERSQIVRQDKVLRFVNRQAMKRMAQLYPGRQAIIDAAKPYLKYIFSYGDPRKNKPSNNKPEYSVGHNLKELVAATQNASKQVTPDCPLKFDGFASNFLTEDRKKIMILKDPKQSSPDHDYFTWEMVYTNCRLGLADSAHPATMRLRFQVQRNEIL